MHYYSEETGRELRELFELEVLRWPGVTSRVMYGCPSYQVEGRLFAFLVSGGLVVTRLLRSDREILAQRHTIGEFKAGERVIKYWTRVDVADLRELSYILPYVRKSYEAALARARGIA